MIFIQFLRFLVGTVIGTSQVAAASPDSPKCRALPGEPSFPNATILKAFNTSIDGRLLTVVPSGEFCQQLSGGCPDQLWFNGNFRNDIPGAMLEVNWEQDYTSNPPSLCFRNSTVCGQGNVPVLAINATTAAHIQTGINFARNHNLKVAIKASGHDYLGRSTAKGSLLLWTRYFQNITFHDNFTINGKGLGNAVTVGSGVGLHALYNMTKEKGQIFVGGTAASVVAAGGYVQGAGHSALSPTFGLAADNALQFQVVVADGSLLTVNTDSHPDLFWALRGGGAGSWGVIVSATLRTYSTFNIVHQSTTIVANTSEQVATLATLHAKHIFDWDPLHPGQYFYWSATPPTFTWSIDSYFPNVTIEAAIASLTPFLNGVKALGFSANTSQQVLLGNDALGASAADLGGFEAILGSRLWPRETYIHNATAIGQAYQTLFDNGVFSILGNLIAGGQVSRNALVNNAVHPKWRTAKTHMIVVLPWLDTTPLEEVEAIREDMTKNKVPILAALAGPDSAAYSNEADVREPDFKTTFYGPNYARLLQIKEQYDPDGMFIVPAGVGSEFWDTAGICKVF